MDGSFADHPRSVAEIRSERSTDARDWTPRDVLISVLRDIDAGKIAPSAIVVCVDEAEKNKSSWWAASPSMIVSLGLLDYCGKCIYDMRRN